MIKWIDLLWPIRESDKCAEKTAERRRQDDLDAIERANWEDVRPVLEESRRLWDLEMSRRKTAEWKATIYLAALATMLPLTGTLVSLHSAHIYASSQWQIMVLLCGGVLVASYYLAAGVWSFRTIKRSVHHRLDVPDLLVARENSGAEAILCKAILRSVVNDRGVTNDKVTCMAMAHAFCVRFILLYVVLFLLNAVAALWQPAQTPSIPPAQHATKGQAGVRHESSQPRGVNAPDAPSPRTSDESEPIEIGRLGRNQHSK